MAQSVGKTNDAALKELAESGLSLAHDGKTFANAKSSIPTALRSGT
jgi:hypothetical protein